jgi:hypothetical protein
MNTEASAGLTPTSDSSQPWFCFADDTLHIRAPLTEMRVAWRPTPKAEEKTADRRSWQSAWPEFRLLRPRVGGATRYEVDVPALECDARRDREKAAAFDGFRRTVPLETAAAVESFGSHQWALMALLHEQPRAMDLVRSNATLAYMLANGDQFRGTRPAAVAVQAVGHSLRRQRTILEWLGFPGTESMARVIRKIPPVAAAPIPLRLFRNMVRSEPAALRLAAHLPVINAAVLELFFDMRVLDLATPGLLSEIVACDSDERTAADMIRDVLAMVGEMDANRTVKPFANLRKVRSFHDEALQEYHDWQIGRVEAQRAACLKAKKEREQRRLDPRKQPFPPPPVPGTNDIVPVESYPDLRREGRDQCNCVASYLPRILKGHVYIYRVLAPERATLAIAPGYDGYWRRSQLEAGGNRLAGMHARLTVDAWLARYSLSV